MRPGHYMRARLHRRLFVWFGGTILLTGMATFGTMHLVSTVAGEPPFHQVFPRAVEFLAAQAAHTWGDGHGAQQLVDDLHRTLPLATVITDTQGNTVALSGTCERRSASAPIEVHGKTVGTITVCSTIDPSGGPWRAALAIFVVCAVMWAMTGRIARRLTRPLSDLARVAKDIGAGRLESRARLGYGQAGEVGVLAFAINDMASKIEKQLADARTLMAMVSHELRTPLARVRVLVELGRNDASRVAKAFNEIEQEVQEIDVLVGQLLATSRLDFAMLSRQTLAPLDVARRALERAGLPAERLQNDTGVTEVRADPTLLARALANLLENAKKHAHDVAHVRLHSTATHLFFEVEDNGPGIAASRPEEIFELFYQGPNARERDPKSLGLGLALVRRIAEAHGGHAYARNRPEGGAVIGFSVALAAG